jgi:hypothetical protein
VSSLAIADDTSSQSYSWKEAERTGHQIKIMEWPGGETIRTRVRVTKAIFKGICGAIFSIDRSLAPFASEPSVSESAKTMPTQTRFVVSHGFEAFGEPTVVQVVALSLM